MILLFRAEDFFSKTFIQIQKYIGSPVTGRVVDCQEAANIANKILESKLGPRVYGNPNGRYLWHEDVKALAYKPTHQAHLFDVREVEKAECEHEPVSVLDERVKACTLSSGKIGFSYFNEDRWECAKCGAKLKAKWEVAGE